MENTINISSLYLRIPGTDGKLPGHFKHRPDRNKENVYFKPNDHTPPGISHLYLKTDIEVNRYLKFVSKGRRVTKALNWLRRKGNAHYRVYYKAVVVGECNAELGEVSVSVKILVLDRITKDGEKVYDDAVYKSWKRFAGDVMVVGYDLSAHATPVVATSVPEPA